ncbi:MAG TPA: hypothetical protein ACFYEF_00155 [Candidatus Wunengus sp. YC63]|uniref:hypothetical protein n=1 Tax=Candidatus Wunengus sp. YC63 TaxID=3367699 RepID=UPI0040251959
MAVIDEKKDLRLKEWKNWVGFYCEDKRSKGLNISAIEFAPEILNEYYWAIAKKYIKPLLKSTDNQEHNIHYYKIISLSELTVMAITPFIFDDSEDPVSTIAINAEFAFFVAISIMLGWKVGDDHLIDAASLSKAYSYTEIIDVEETGGSSKTYPQDFRVDHIEWLRGLNPSAPMPVVSNSHTWRMLFIAAKFSSQQ